MRGHLSADISCLSPFLERSLTSASESGPRGVNRFPLLNPGLGGPSCDRVAAAGSRPRLRDLLTSSRHPLRSGETVVRPGGVWTPLARPFRTVVARSGGSLGFGPGAALQGPWPTPTQAFGPAPTVGPEALAGRGGLTYLSRSAETNPLSGTCGISVGTRWVPPAPGRPESSAVRR